MRSSLCLVQNSKLKLWDLELDSGLACFVLVLDLGIETLICDNDLAPPLLIPGCFNYAMQCMLYIFSLTFFWFVLVKFLNSQVSGQVSSLRPWAKWDTVTQKLQV